MAAMLESPPCGSVLSGRQHPADSLHQREHHQYDNNDIGLYIRYYMMYRAIKTNNLVMRRFFRIFAAKYAAFFDK